MIMVMRHAEKPNGENGVMPDGRESPDALSPTGWKRAEALGELFAPAGERFANPLLLQPQYIFASGVAPHDKSLWTQQTVAPLARKLNLPIDVNYRVGEEGQLVRAAKAVAGVVLIAWRREGIPEIGYLVLSDDQVVPQHWPIHRFDLGWVFTRSSESSPWRFAQAPQRLLPGDSDIPDCNQLARA